MKIAFVLAATLGFLSAEPIRVVETPCLTDSDCPCDQACRTVLDTDSCGRDMPVGGTCVPVWVPPAP